MSIRGRDENKGVTQVKNLGVDLYAGLRELLRQNILIPYVFFELISHIHFQEADVTPDPVLYGELESISQQPLSMKLSSDKTRILDFFINLAVCNTVVLSTDNKSQRTTEQDMVVSIILFSSLPIV